jgi:hypothetical protein
VVTSSEVLELVQQTIEFFVGDFRIVENVVPLFVVANGLAQIANAFFGGLHRSRERT